MGRPAEISRKKAQAEYDNWAEPENETNLENLQLEEILPMLNDYSKELLLLEIADKTELDNTLNDALDSLHERRSDKVGAEDREELKRRAIEEYESPTKEPPSRWWVEKITSQYIRLYESLLQKETGDNTKDAFINLYNTVCKRTVESLKDMKKAILS